MLKVFLNKLPVATLIIIFLYVCGSLYLIGYWSTFGIYVFTLVDLIEIPKNFIFPFILSSGYYFVLLFFSKIYTPNFYKEPINSNSNSLVDNIIIVITTVAAIILYIFVDNYLFWGISTVLLSTAIVNKAVKSELIKEVLPNFGIRKFILSVVIFTPIAALVGGKVSGLTIYKNHLTRQISVISKATNIDTLANNDSTRLKLLGFLGDKIIISTLDNEKILILNQSSFDIVEIKSVRNK